jgi:L-seryl-tRNA(Ser) seleniumtransferase
MRWLRAGKTIRILSSSRLLSAIFIIHLWHMEKSTGAHEISAGLRRNALLARIPPVHQLLEHPEFASLYEDFRRERIADAIRLVLDELRHQILSGSVPMDAAFCEAALASKVSKLLQGRSAPRLARVINATGVALHTNLGRAPLAQTAVSALQDVAEGYCNLEFNLDSGKRGSRYDHVEELLCRLTGAQAALVVNNCAAAVLLTLMALAEQGEVLVSRGELVEIGGSFRMSEVIAQSGARLVEVGATNKTAIRDYECAITERTRMILKSHPSNYRITGFTAQPARSELSRLARQHKLVYAEDLGSGTLVDLRRYGLPHEPTVQECVRAGTQVVTFSGDKLLGGPQAGIIVGCEEEIERMKRHPLVRALRIDKLSLAALEATLCLYEQPVPPEDLIPVLGMLAKKKEALRRRANALARKLRCIPGLACRVEEGISLAGGGSLPEAGLPTCTVKIKDACLNAEHLTHRLRRQQPALVGRIVDDWFVMDLRTVTPEEVRLIPGLVHGAVA